MLLTTPAMHRALVENEIPVAMSTIIGWAQRHHIAKKIGGRWFFEPAVLDALIAGDRLDDIAARLRQDAPDVDEPKPTA
jgi:hypothetical protein